MSDEYPWYIPNTVDWYIPNTVDAGHRLDDVAGGWADLDLSTELARILEDHGWGGALIGTGWGRPDTFTVGLALVLLLGGWMAIHGHTSAGTIVAFNAYVLMMQPPLRQLGDDQHDASGHRRRPGASTRCLTSGPT